MRMTQRLSLVELQQAFGSLSTYARHGRSALAADQLVCGAGKLSPAESMEIYANMFIWRQVDSLQEDFPKLATLTGDEFYSLCQAYLAEHPSQHHSLSRLGHALPSFLATRQELRPDLSDLAALEAARNEVFDEASSVTLSAPQAVDRALTVIPALRLLTLKHDVAPIWKAIEDGTSVPDARHTASCIVVWRRSFEVFHVRLDAVEAEAFARAVAGRPLREICEAFSDDPEPLTAASRAIGSWFSECWIAQGAP
jgi:hypothetical protein